MLYVLLPLLISFSFGFSGESLSQEEINRNYCKGLIDNGNYKNAGNQIFCHDYFDMAPAYLVKCLSFQVEGFSSDLDGKACEIYLSENENWGPWEDYAPAQQIEELLQEYRGEL